MTQPVGTIFWIQVQENTESAAAKLAKRISANVYHDSHTSGVYGFAKLHYAESKWQVRVFQINSNPNNGFNKIESEFNGQVLIKSLSLRNDSEFAPLLVAIQNTIQVLEQQPEQIINPDRVERNLQKLFVYLLLSPKWPYNPNQTSVEGVVAIFQKYKGYFSSKDLTAQNQEKFNTFISALAKHLRQQSMTLEDYTLKVRTKLRKDLPRGAFLFQGVQKTINSGIERILWPNPSPEQDIVSFCEVVAQHTYVFKPDADTDQARAALQTSVDRLVRLLVDYDLEHKSSTLFKFIMTLMTSLHTQCTADSRNLVALSPLVWILEALVGNDHCIEYLRPVGRITAQQQQNIVNVTSALFEQESCWHAVSRYIVYLGNAEVFDQVLVQKIEAGKETCHMTQYQLTTIFRFLNERLSKEVDGVMIEQYKIMSLNFLRRLSDTNHLHHLQAYAARPEHFEQLRKNLVRLGFNVMGDPSLELTLLFGNPAYQALGIQTMDRGDKVRRTLLRLFTKFAPNKVMKSQVFEQVLGSMTTDFSNEYEHFAEEVLSQVGRLSPQGVDKTSRRNLVPVEEWLKDVVVPIYQSLKEYVIRCIPLQWYQTTFNGAESLKHKICLHEGRLYLIGVKDDECVLNDFFTSVPYSESSDPMEIGNEPKRPKGVARPESAEYSDDYIIVKQRLRKELSEPANRTAISYLTEQYMPFIQNETTKFAIEPLMQVLFAKMKSEAAIPMAGRIYVIANFLKDMAPFLNALTQHVVLRFFPSQKLKITLALNLRQQAMTRGIQIGTELAQLQAGSSDAYSDARRDEVCKVVCSLCLEEIKEILHGCSLEELKKIITQFEAILFRKFDELSYTIEEFTTEFTNRNQARAGSSDLKTILGDLPIRDKIMQDFGAILKTRKPAVNFILPNQAIAIRVCEGIAFATRNILLKLGTGQGKSVVIAVTALLEAQGNPNGKIFVFTSYDYLAKRDHDLAAKFFERDRIRSVCISSITDIAKFNSEIRVIYADIERIDFIVREIILKLLTNHATESEKLFLRTIYSTSSDHHIILDEYDLLLYDLEEKSPYGMHIPTTLLSPDFVRNKQAYCPWLPTYIETASATSTASEKRHIDGATGKGFYYAKWHDFNRGFHVPVSVTRISSLMKKSKRVIGLSGTAISQETHGLASPLFFELPSSQNPKAFETVIQRDAAKPTTEFSYIARSESREFPVLQKQNPTDRYYTISEVRVSEYCDAIIADVKKAQEPKVNGNVEYKRPVLIFADPTIEYKTPGSRGAPVRLWDTLKAKMIANGISNVGELEDDVTDDELQTIVSRTGCTTLATIKWGRGADIRPNSSIIEGLHVVVATNVIHDRVLDQLIGRTGRMGRDGSYSIFTFGKVIQPTPKDKHRSSEFYAALHELTKLFVHRVMRDGHCSEELAGKWLMFITNCCCNMQEKITKSQALELCGVAQFGEDVVPAKFFR